MTAYKIDFTDKKGIIKPMHGVGNAPLLGVSNRLFHYLGEAGIPYSRLHDTGGTYGGGCFVDIANIFRDMSADPSDPASYDFAFTDWLLSELDKQNVKPFYRLGASIECEHRIKAYRIFPPEDELKWARICEGIIRHYNEGWANGFRYGIKYWEIWNEPDNEPEIADNPMWKGTKEQFFRLYETASNHLKSCFPDIKIGGYASCGFYAISDSAFSADANSSHRVEYFLEFFRDFMEYITSPGHRSPLDFFSWHSYLGIEKNISYAEYARKELDSYGFTDTENILNEWNMGPSLRGTQEDAAHILGMMCAMQDTPIDKLMYYDAQVNSSYGGLFDPLHKTVFRAYYAFKAFNEIYKLGTQVSCTCVSDAAPHTETEAVAAANENGECGVLITNMKPAETDITVDLSEGREVSCIVSDGARIYEEAHDYTYDADSKRISCKMSPHCFRLFRIRL